MPKVKSRNSLARRIVEIYATWITVPPILAGLLLGMFLIIGIGIFILAFPGFWLLADPGILWSPGGSSWLTAFVRGPYPTPSLILFEAIVFFAGLFLFLFSLFTLAREKSRDGDKLVKNGPYRSIRHPQHLGQIMMTLPLALYIPTGGDLGIRPGDLVSWTQFVFLIAIFSDREDLQLQRRFRTAHLEYYVRTGFLWPKLFPSRQPGYFSVFRHHKARYALFITLYVSTVIGLYMIYLSVPVMQW